MPMKKHKQSRPTSPNSNNWGSLTRMIAATTSLLVVLARISLSHQQTTATTTTTVTASSDIHAAAHNNHTCNYPGSPAHASVTFNTSQIVTGTAASYTCDNGYELLGPPRRFCQANGTWAPVGIPFCVLFVSSTTGQRQHRHERSVSEKLQPRRRQSQATLSSHKQSLLTGSANSHLTSPYNQFYLTNNVNSPHNVISSLLTGPWIYPLSIKEGCTTASDNRAGICMPKKACLSSGGYVAGTCGILGSCCVYQGTCRTIIAANETYFVSPAFPSMHKERLDPPVCIFTLQRSPIYNKWPICQFRLSFDEFSLSPPINGTCGGKTDSFIVSGAVNFNTSGLPTAGLCGDMSGQHMYLDVDPERPDDPLLLIVNTANEQRYNRRWSIRVQQIACHSPYRAPNGCLQYHTAESGIIESFNYRGNGRSTAFPGSSVLPIRSVPQYPTLQFISSPNYFNDLYYGVCIQKLPRACAIKWQAIHFDFGGTLAGLSDVSSPNSQTYGCVRNDGLAMYGADLGDYVAIQGASRDGRARLQSQFCGQRLNSLPQQDVNDEIISYAKPFTMIVRTDNLAGLHSLPQAPKSQKGFRLKYRQLACK